MPTVSRIFLVLKLSSEDNNNNKKNPIMFPCSSHDPIPMLSVRKPLKFKEMYVISRKLEKSA